MSEKKEAYIAALELPERPASKPCDENVIGVELAAFYRSGIACRRCRHWLIDITTMSDQEPQYTHGHKIPPEIREESLDRFEYAKNVVTWIEQHFYEKLQTQKSWDEEEIKGQFKETLADLLFEWLGGNI